MTATIITLALLLLIFLSLIHIATLLNGLGELIGELLDELRQKK